TLLQDIRYAVRGLFRNPGFTMLAVLSLAVGVGVNTSMFSIASGVLWQELPVPEADRLVRLFQVRESSNNFSYPNFVDVKDQGDFFEGVFAHELSMFGLTSGELSQIAYGEIVSANYFEVLRIQPILGRVFDPSTEDQPESPFVTVLSHHLWTESFGADPAVVGSVIKVNGRDVSVIGVAPEGFDGTKFGLGMDLWVPIRSWRAAEGWGTWEERRGSANMMVVARLAPGSEITDANAGLRVIGERLEERYPESNRGLTFKALPERHSQMSADAPQMANLIGLVAIAASGLVLLVACGNVASLLLSRAVVRRREIGLRVAMGAGRARLLRQFFTESTILALLGGALGLTLATFTSGLFQRFIPSLPYRFTMETSPDMRAVLFTIAASLAATFVFGLAPALQASKPGVAGVLRGDESSSGGLRFSGTKLLNTVVVGMVAMAFVTLFLAGLFTRSLSNVRDMEMGFQTEGRIMATLDLALAGDADMDPAAFFDQLVDQVAALPGVTAAAVSSGMPLGDWASSSGIYASDRAYSPDERGMNSWRSSISDSYFEALGTRLMAGRAFTPEDRSDNPGTVILNTAAAERLWPGEDPIGRSIRFSRDPAANTFEVVGIAETGRYHRFQQSVQPAFFRPLRQSPRGRVILTVQAAVDPVDLVAPMRGIVKDLHPAVPLFDVKTLDEHVTGSLFLFRMGAEMAMALGLIALVLAATGLYGVMTFRVGQRRHEMGIRLALGAGKQAVVTNVMAGS
ncbi:MAG: ABC transporter permease, partial [Longimicrobiales bacterium]